MVALQEKASMCPRENQQFPINGFEINQRRKEKAWNKYALTTARSMGELLKKWHHDF